MRKNRGHIYEARDLKTGESKTFAAVRARNAWIAEDKANRTVWPVNAAVRRANRKEPDAAAHRARRAPHGEIDTHHTGDWLRDARLALGMTQAQLGEAVGITATEVYRKEKMREGRRLTRAQVLAVECLLRRADRWPL